jgi:tetratricopeptide (TPR) repeat protein
MIRPPLAPAVIAALAISLPAHADAWTRSLEKKGIDPNDVPNPIAITPRVEQAARTWAGGGGGDVDQLRRIQSALYDPTRFNLVYDAGTTLTAEEALEAGRGNCVTSTSLFIALARARGIRVRPGYVTPRAIGEKKGDLVFVTTHVVAVFENFQRSVVFDFYRESQEPSTVELIDDLTLAALYLNNRAVDRLSRGELEAAEHDFDIVVKLAPQFVAAHANLGVLRRRRGEVSGAFDAYRKALALDPDNPVVLGNLAALYASLGRSRDAKAALELADLGEATPYTILARGDLEMADGRYDDALKLYRRAARAGPRLPEPYVAIARLERARGRPAEARRAIDRALRLVPGHAEAASLDAELKAAGGVPPP